MTSIFVTVENARKAIAWLEARKPASAWEARYTRKKIAALKAHIRKVEGR